MKWDIWDALASAWAARCAWWCTWSLRSLGLLHRRKTDGLCQGFPVQTSATDVLWHDPQMGRIPPAGPVAEILRRGRRCDPRRPRPGPAAA
jgi:hypothetical protein